MRSQQLRRAIVQARYGETLSNLLLVEFAFVGVFVGIHQDSVQLGVMLVIALLVGLYLPIISLLIVLLLGTLWAVVCVVVAYEVFGLLGAVVIGGFGAMVSYGVHVGGLRGAKDARF